jgi:3'(2'), 5'-bisphosphate nucleotidase
MTKAPSPLQDLPSDLTARLVSIAREAGDRVLEIYEEAEDVEFTRKDDDSPLTEADLASHESLVESLEAMTPDVPILSEESADEITYEDRSDWELFWLVDPLDGTKEFIKRNGEFTVNVALVRGHDPIAGIVHAPALDVTWHGAKGEGAHVIEDGTPRSISASPPDEGQSVHVMASRSHLNEPTKRFADRYEDHTFQRAGSSLKICRVADASAHVYPRLAPTMEWDTAAGQAVLEAAGGVIVEADDEGDPSPEAPLRYNKRDLTNPHFVAAASQALLE